MRPGPVAVFAVLAALTGPAAADRAAALYQNGKRLLAQKNYADACEAFVAADRLEPDVDVKLSAARCFAEWGKLATAYDWYADAQRLAERTGDDRGRRIAKLAAELDAEIPRLTIRVPDGADRKALTTLALDGVPFVGRQLGTEQRVDPGPHLIEFVVAGEKRRKIVPVERGGGSEVMLDIPPAGPVSAEGPSEDEPPIADAPAPHAQGRTQRIAGLSLAAGGVIALGAAGALTLDARGAYRDALDTHCMGSTTLCDPEGLAITLDARSTANLATIVTIAGGALVAGGVALYLLAPTEPADERRALYLVPSIGPAGGAVVLGGRY